MSAQKRDTVSAVMSKKVYTISSIGSIRKAIDIMIEHNVGSIVITNGKKPIGIITERDVLRKVVGDWSLLKEPVKKIASEKLVTVHPDTPIWKAFALMLKNRIRRLPVVEKTGGNLAGIATERDLFRWVVGVLYEPAIPPDVIKLISKSSP